jgi:hypothetical protein
MNYHSTASIEDVKMVDTQASGINLDECHVDHEEGKEDHFYSNIS